MTVTHGTFSIERIFPAPPERVFAAWSDAPAKARWFGEDDDFLASTGTYSLDFRVGGREHLEGTLPGDGTFAYDAVYGDIVAGSRIIASYDVHIDGRRISVSLLTVELTARPGGTHLALTEQGAFLDGLDTNGEREKGARGSLDRLDEYLRGGNRV